MLVQSQYLILTNLLTALVILVLKQVEAIFFRRICSRFELCSKLLVHLSAALVFAQVKPY